MLSFIKSFERLPLIAAIDVWVTITRCKTKPDCSPPCFHPRRLLIIANWWGSGFAWVQRSTCTSCRIPSHASVWKMSKEEMSSGGNVRSKGGSVRFPAYWCGQRKSSTVVFVHHTYDGRARRGWKHKVYYTRVTVLKNFLDCINKNWLSWQRLVSDRNPISPQSSTPVKLPVLKIGRRSVAHFLR